MTLAGTSFIGDTAAAVIILRDPRPGTGANGTGANNAEKSEAERESQLRLATANRDELNSLLRTLQQTRAPRKNRSIRPRSAWSVPKRSSSVSRNI